MSISLFLFLCLYLSLLTIGTLDTAGSQVQARQGSQSDLVRLYTEMKKHEECVDQLLPRFNEICEQIRYVSLSGVDKRPVQAQSYCSCDARAH